MFVRTIIASLLAQALFLTPVFFQVDSRQCASRSPFVHGRWPSGRQEIETPMTGECHEYLATW
jgi:hypothetical protein